MNNDWKLDDTTSNPTHQEGVRVMTRALYIVMDRKCLPMLPTVTPVKAMAIRYAQDYNAMPSREHQRPFGVARLKVVEYMFSPEHLEVTPAEKENG